MFWSFHKSDSKHSHKDGKGCFENMDVLPTDIMPNQKEKTTFCAFVVPCTV